MPDLSIKDYNVQSKSMTRLIFHLRPILFIYTCKTILRRSWGKQTLPGACPLKNEATIKAEIEGAT